MTSGPIGHRWLSGEFKSFDAQQCSILVNWVVNIWQVLQGGALSDSAELVVHWTVANADPSVVGSQIWNWDATQMGADCWAHQHLSISCGAQHDLAWFVQNGLSWVLVVFLVDFLSSKSSDEDWSAVPDNLENLSRRETGNVDFHVGIPVVSSPAVEPADDSDCVESGEIEEAAVYNSVE